jgi:hypothetical protein
MLNKLSIITELYKVCYPTLPSLYMDNVGAELAYITQAILSGQKCELAPVSGLVKLLKANFSSTHQIWNHIIVEPTVLCINCEAEVLWPYASYCPPLSGWLGHSCCVDAGDVEGYYEELSYGR